jgi:predicted transcriptional regulator
VHNFAKKCIRIMSAALSNFETEVLNKLIPTQTFGNPSDLKKAIRNILDQNREVLRTQGVTDLDFKLLQAQTGQNIFEFLRSREFYFEREGGVFYLTDKGKQLRAQGSLEKYMEWREQLRIKNMHEMSAIREKGYIENTPAAGKEPEPKKKKFGFFTF